MPEPPGKAILVFNLFSLEGYTIAEKLKLQSTIAAHPYLIPYAPPASFASRFKNAFPQLWAALHCGDSSVVSWGDVEHWMWPLFTERWHRWRTQLGLSSVPLLDSSRLPKPTPVLYGVSTSFTPRPGYWPNSIHFCGLWLTKGPPPEVDEVLQRWLATSTHRLVVGFDFGSSGSLGLIA